MQPYSYIYVIKNHKNQKCYVGKTNNPKSRWSSHKNINSKQLISKAIRKYGKEYFEFQVIYTSFSLEDTLEKETYFIKFYNSHYTDGYGYNATYCSCGASKGNVPWNKGKLNVYSDEVLKNMSISHIGKTPWNKGKLNPTASINGKKSAEKLRSTCIGRKRATIDNKLTWIYYNNEKWCTRKSTRIKSKRVTTYEELPVQPDFSVSK